MDEWDEPIEETDAFDRRIEESSTAAEPGWKDELNLAEFPIAALTDRIPDGQTTMVFEDRLERRDSTPIVRRLTIMGTHKHGLPTSLDDEVLVGLIQLTKRRSNFTDPRVQFSRYELISSWVGRRVGKATDESKRPCTAGSAWCSCTRMHGGITRLEAGWMSSFTCWITLRSTIGSGGELLVAESRSLQGENRTQRSTSPPALVELPLERSDFPELSKRKSQAA